MHRLYSLMLLVVTCGLSVCAQRICNNGAALCDRKYNSITHLGAHDSPFIRNAATGFTPFGNQYYDTVTQLDAGIRLVSGQVHRNGNSWDLCHSSCLLSHAGSLSTWLQEIKKWLDGKPDEVVTMILVNSDNANAEELHQQFLAADLAKYAYTPQTVATATSDWPTLGQMIDQNKRLVVFVASLPPSSNTIASYLLDEFTHIFENSYDVSDSSKFACLVDRPKQLQNQDIHASISSGYMPLMNHMLYNRLGPVTFPADDKVEDTNASRDRAGNLGDHANQCTSSFGRPPAYILVDFFNVGQSFEVVDRLNGISGQTSGRINLPNTVIGSLLHNLD